MPRSRISRSPFRATTALTLSLSLMQPTMGFGQAVEGGNGEDAELRRELCLEAPDLEGCDAILEGDPEIPGDTPAEVPDETPDQPDIEPVTPTEAPEPDLPEPEIPEPATPEPEIPEPQQPEIEQPEIQQAPQGAPEAEGEADMEAEVEITPADDVTEEAPAGEAPAGEAGAEGTQSGPAPEQEGEQDAEQDAGQEGEQPLTLEAIQDAEGEADGEAPADPEEVTPPVTPEELGVEEEATEETTEGEATETEATDTEATETDPAIAEEVEQFEALPEGTEAPEVIEAPETVEAPLEASPQPTAEDDARVQRLLEDPEVAGAVDTLTRALALQSEEEAVETDPAAEGETTEQAETTEPADGTATATAAGAALAALLATQQGEGAGDLAPADVIEQVLTRENSRSSAEDFDSRIVTLSSPQAQREEERRGLTRLEQAGLLALGAVAVGMLVGNNRVVANSGDRVVVDRGDGNLAVWKDDDALIRQPGSTERVERYNDGSTRTVLDRQDGSQIITVRDATGRVLWRERREPNGETVRLIDDTQRYAPVDVSRLPPPRIGEVRVTERTDTAMLRALLAEAEAQDLGRTFSLRQVRETRELRELAPEISTDPITFETASSVVRTSEARKLVQIGRLMQEMIAENPREIFLIEGHTDAVGSASYNLALSDRRAESVALALTEYFGVPPENLVVQGYGERFLKVQTQAAEQANRRVAVRRITWLLNNR
ncbi:OmpA family protein [Halodurantibacterium flavum]|uniref:OmpA family protein n=1 Tax=Halodurantibacterium flavum TaxID=1382802 RepID=A0ABW4S406_9RHOB